jgi:uncharacterized membrane protein
MTSRKKSDGGLEKEVATRSTGDQSMKAIALTIGALGLAMSLHTAPVQAQAAQSYPWCAEDSGSGTMSCTFVSFAQCQEAVAGVGNFCLPNPEFGRRDVNY